LKTEPSIFISSLSDTNKNDHDNITAAQLAEYLKRIRMTVEATVQGYDFFLVVERLQESLVVLAWLTGASLSEIFYFIALPRYLSTRLLIRLWGVNASNET